MEMGSVRIVKSNHPINYQYSFRVADENGCPVWLTFQQLTCKQFHDGQKIDLIDQWVDIPIIQEWER